MFSSPPLPPPGGEGPMTQVYNKHNPQSRQQIFKSLGIDTSSPSTLMDNAMPVPAILSCTTI